MKKSRFAGHPFRSEKTAHVKLTSASVIAKGCDYERLRSR